MRSARVTCVRCKGTLPAETFNTPGLTLCPTCGSELRAWVFLAFYQPTVRGHAGETVTVPDEASCFYHPQKKAAVPCERCGRFLCALCDVELNGEHICPACLQAGQEKGKLEALDHKRTRYDEIATMLAIVPLVPVFWFFSPVTAPAALFIALRYWKTPCSLVARSKWRFVLAALLAGAQILFWLGLLGWLYLQRGG